MSNYLKMKKFFLFFNALVIVLTIFSCSSDDDNNDRDVTLADLGLEKNVKYKVQRYRQIDKDYNWDYVDFSPNIYVTILDDSSIEEINEDGSSIVKYNLIPTKISSYPNPNSYIETYLDFIEDKPTPIFTYIISARKNCKFYRSSEGIFLHKPLGSSYFESYKFVKD